ncbi:MBL fold metallo-hydrolase [Roseofilum capinflatum]|uniref:MBL fold metallo-hydrolase n=1 Tax=Roseofilum capinflatum BLCC-M114 TaxID=3022440 RepID=A0ABT7B6H4_9CYAN|nr:MBL fold metallo-hydrolase [Roseofilum capinflatum]MDJ1174782.1 MBL fold metallo-hydrolase [Roseofilum capinflatum BLCC-M114]
MASSYRGNPKDRNLSPKQPKVILENRFAFPPNRETLGATSYFIVGNSGNILIDCPAWNQTNQDFLRHHGGVQFLFLTHRGAIAKVREIQQTFNCQIIIQEQEAYLLPKLSVTPFQYQFTFSDLQIQALWTPGHSPGSSCLYDPSLGGILFTGRHLLPNSQGHPTPLRTSKTFHWKRQLASVQQVLETFKDKPLEYLCPGANTGLLRGQGVIQQAYHHLKQLDLETSL